MSITEKITVTCTPSPEEDIDDDIVRRAQRFVEENGDVPTDEDIAARAELMTLKPIPNIPGIELYTQDMLDVLVILASVADNIPSAEVMTKLMRWKYQ